MVERKFPFGSFDTGTCWYPNRTSSCTHSYQTSCSCSVVCAWARPAKKTNDAARRRRQNPTAKSVIPFPTPFRFAGYILLRIRSDTSFRMMPVFSGRGSMYKLPCPPSASVASVSPIKGRSSRLGMPTVDSGSPILTSGHPTNPPPPFRATCEWYLKACDLSDLRSLPRGWTEVPARISTDSFSRGSATPAAASTDCLPPRTLRLSKGRTDQARHSPGRKRAPPPRPLAWPPRGRHRRGRPRHLLPHPEWVLVAIGLPVP